MKHLLISLMVFLAVACGSPPKESGESEQVTESVKKEKLPPIPLTLLSGDTVKLSTKPGKFMLIFFTPGCDHCERQAKMIQENLNSFGDYSLYFIAANDPTSVRTFAETYKLLKEPNVFFALASGEEVYRLMGPIATPTLLLYSSDKTLLKRFDKETEAKELVKYLELNR